MCRSARHTCLRWTLARTGRASLRPAPDRIDRRGAGEVALFRDDVQRTALQLFVGATEVLTHDPDATLGYPNLAFNVSGPLEIQGGCVEALEVPLDTQGSAVTVAPCNDGPRQQWDSYW